MRRRWRREHSHAHCFFTDLSTILYISAEKNLGEVLFVQKIGTKESYILYSEGICIYIFFYFFPNFQKRILENEGATAVSILPVWWYVALI